VVSNASTSWVEAFETVMSLINVSEELDAGIAGGMQNFIR
jgi:hypothetical protein